MPTKAELYEVATELDIDGRSEMTKAELSDAIAAAQDTETANEADVDDGPATTETGDFLCPNCGKPADHIHAKGV